MADLYLMNGTNTVGMNGTSTVGMNGTNDVGGAFSLNGGFYSTADVVPSRSLNGLTSGITLNGVDCCDLHPYSEELNGIDDDDPNADAIRLALMYGDADVVDAYENGELNGIAEILAARKARLASETPEQKAARKARRNKLISTVLSAASLSPVGGGIAAKLKGKLDQAIALADKTGAALESAGVQPDAKALATRAATETVAGAADQESESTGLMAKWKSLSPVAKGAIIGGVALGGFLLIRKFTGKKRKKR